MKRVSEQSAYERHGYASRRDYLLDMASEYGVPIQVVLAVAAMLGESEDFDGLVNALEDWEEFGACFS
jgi:hypothetical protein